MGNLRPESRIKSLEQRATDIEAGIIELSSDTAETLNALSAKLDQGFLQAHAFVQERFEIIDSRLERIEGRLNRQEELLLKILEKLQ